MEPFNVDFSFVGGSFKNKSMVNQSITSPTATINPTELYGLTGITKLPIEIDVLISATNKFAKGPNNVPNVLVEDKMVSTNFRFSLFVRSLVRVLQRR